MLKRSIASVAIEVMEKLTDWTERFEGGGYPQPNVELSRYMVVLSIAGE